MNKNSGNGSKRKKKAKETMSIATVVSLDGSSKSGCKIVMLRCDGSQATLTTLANITEDGMKFIRVHGWIKMFESSGLKEIAAMMESGNDQ